MKQNVGLYGGSFDPIHLGHLLVAQAAFEEAKLNELFFIPAAQSPFKTSSLPAPAADRLRLLRLAMAGKNQYHVDDQEIARGGVSYTIDTVRAYNRQFPEANLFYLIGADNVETLKNWREAEELAQLTQFLVIPRPGQPDISLPTPFQGKMLRGFPFGVSSSQIRSRIRSGLSIENLVPPTVAEAIRNYHLYF